MIKLFSGTPGSGKSLHLARLIKFALDSGIYVISNFDVNHSLKGYDKYYFVYDMYKLTPEMLMGFSRMCFGSNRPKEDSILFIMDECHRIYNPRTWQMKGRSNWLDFYTLHRHYGYFVVLSAQFDKQLDAQLRPLIEYECVHRKVSNFGLRGKFLSLLLGGKTFFSINYWYPVRQKMGTEIIHGTKKLFSVYDTFHNF